MPRHSPRPARHSFSSPITHSRGNSHVRPPSRGTSPALDVQLVGGSALTLLEAFAGKYGVLFNRGARCSFCTGQLRQFQRSYELFTAAGIEVLSRSVDNEVKAAGLIEEDVLTSGRAQRRCLPLHEVIGVPSSIPTPLTSRPPASCWTPTQVPRQHPFLRRDRPADY